MGNAFSSILSGPREGRKMFTFLASLVLVISGVVMYSQKEYIILNERMETISSVPDRGSFKPHFFKHNRTYTALNFTIGLKMDLNNDVDMVVQAYKMISNEYRFFPLSFKENLCDVFKNNLFGLRNLLDCGNLTECPLKKGAYTVCNWGPDYYKFPPYIPYGQYRINLQFQHAAKEIFTVGWFAKVMSVDPLKN